MAPIEDIKGKAHDLARKAQDAKTAVELQVELDEAHQQLGVKTQAVAQSDAVRDIAKLVSHIQDLTEQLAAVAPAGTGSDAGTPKS
jgi:hypothetical protein